MTREEELKIIALVSKMDAKLDAVAANQERLIAKVDDHEKKIYSNVGFTSFITILLSSIITFGISIITKQNHN